MKIFKSDGLACGPEAPLTLGAREYQRGLSINV